MISCLILALFATAQASPLPDSPYSHTSFKIQHGDGQISDFDTSISKSLVEVHQRGIPGDLSLEDRFYPHVEPFLAFRKVNLEDIPVRSYPRASQPVKRRVFIQPEAKEVEESLDEGVFESFDDTLSGPN
eukprot:TRINITY_DN1870_c0_g1_i1.p1 TRINITY_DN1870_c0_g1~~TRINITY_DN1870_c0_g1_i1.p1  ORF type:complete len:130 (-),score=47.50 TRINITY_DN1870_c0_g1_i1:273-662(-)